MLKKLKLLGLCFVLVATLVACQQVKSSTTELVCEDLSKKEEYLLNLTDNKVLMYHFNNLPENKNYKVILTYQVYEEDKLVEEECITEFTNKGNETNEIETIAFNIKEDKISYILGQDKSYVRGDYEIKEKLPRYSQTFLSTNTKLELGTEIFIYHANVDKSTGPIINLGEPITEEKVGQFLKKIKKSVLIKLSFKEI